MCSFRFRPLPLAGGLLFALMMGLTACGLDTPLNRMAFSGTSAEYMMTIVSGSAVLQGLLLLGTGYGIYRFVQRPAVGWAGLVLSLAFCWCLSGRKVGVLLWPKGRVYVGWFNIQTEQFSLCTPTEDCETTTLHTVIIPLSFWRVRILNAHSQYDLFIGPVTWAPTLCMLHQTFGPPTKIPQSVR
jgi:hypothetical protein